MIIDSNPLLIWESLSEFPPFSEIEAKHFGPVFETAIQEHLRELGAIISDPAPPSFENVAAAFDRSGARLAGLKALFSNLLASEASDALQAVEREWAPKLASHDNSVFLLPGLFARIDALSGQPEAALLGDEQRRLLDCLRLDFLKAGAGLPLASQVRQREIMSRLAALNASFAQNVLADESSYHLLLRREDELEGLPEFMRLRALQAATERSHADAYLISLSDVASFLTYSERRDLRKQVYMAWVSRGEHEGPHDNRPIVREILSLRRELARLHGFGCFAEYALVGTMAGKPSAASKLLSDAWGPAKARAEQERRQLQALMGQCGEAFPLEAWDWRFYAEKVRQAHDCLDEAELSQYLSVSGMTAAMFDCAQRLFGIVFELRADLVAYHPDVLVYEVRNAEGHEIGKFLLDNHARPTKRSGAWMGVYRNQSRNADGSAIRPIVVNNNNFPKGAGGAPALLSLAEARMLFHEFGHALHALLSDVTYDRLSGINVVRDFVELPSQLFEKWLLNREVLRRHARHYRTGEPLPEVLLNQVLSGRRLGQGFDTVRDIATMMLDLAVHSATDVPCVTSFEAAELERIGLPSEMGVNHRLTHFQHLFGFSYYAASYYVYLWAEVLDADVFEAFVEAGDPFDPATARRLHECIFATGSSVEAALAFSRFRGRSPRVEPMLRQRGLLE